MQKIFIILLIFAITEPAAAQLSDTDSLKELIHKSKTNDTLLVERLISVSIPYNFSIPDSGIYYGEKALKIANDIRFRSGEADACNSLQHAYLSRGDYSQSMHYALEAIRMYQELNDVQSVAEINSSIGDIYNKMGDYKVALHYYFEFRNIIEKQADSYFKATGYLYNSKEDALMYSDFKIASTYLTGNMPDSALFFAKRGYVTSVQLNGEGKFNYTILGNIYSKINQLDSALKYYLLRFKDNSYAIDDMAVLLGLAEIYRKKNNIDSCIYFAAKAFDKSQQIGVRKEIMEASNLLAWAYEKTDVSKSLSYYKISIAQKDTLYDQEKISRVNSLLFGEELRKKELQAADLKYRNNLRTFALSAALVIFLSVALILWRSILHRKKAFAALEQQKKETDLQKEKVEAALSELNATQAQLVQSAKMASLGELTAGIAHEIQNPLNFVNNFSEVNKELLIEMKDEIANGNTNEVIAIANNVIENQEKINQHGKRADNIVKGMLQHSRKSSGEKEPTDINALADEYLRLAYHGLRAKEKDFNAILKTDFDKNIGKINVLPHDLGRVILNLVNNAFFAVRQKQKDIAKSVATVEKLSTLYEPTVELKTKRLDNNVLITLKDNGIGIPQNIVDKIFQPFFTTKPTGQGTGLGLSMGYDIVKAHGGEIKVSSEEGQFTEFAISLPLT